MQKSHIEVLSTILLNKKNYFHSDAIALARSTLRDLYDQIRIFLNVKTLDSYTYAHLSESANKIQSIYTAKTITD